LVYDRARDTVTHTRFHNIVEYLRPNDLLVINQTRVILARVFGKKIPTGGKVELLMLRQESDRDWEVMVGGKGIIPGLRIQLEDGLEGEIRDNLGGPLRLIRFQEPVEETIQKTGQVPLPPYITEELDKPEKYQTVFARESGSAAAPTAGLHFTPQLLKKIRDYGVRIVEVTLHIGLDTFAPVQEDDPRNHLIHQEWCQLSEDAAEGINKTRERGGRVFAVGTTTVRTLETAARASQEEGFILPYQGNTDLFILPGFEFGVVDCLITNFHLPESTLIMMVSAFAGREKILDLYRIAMDEGYRFYSFGDAMLLL
jgi:S-adenosylmethionine:tRNA ribosyltransferase-isomerase